MNSPRQNATELMVSEWLNTPSPITLDGLTGKVVVIEAFQMLCPGCVSHGLPQAKEIAETFDSEEVTVLGLHTVFEHHEAQGTREALAAFLHEYRVEFPVGIDAISGGDVPKTMTAYQLRGTPSLILIDRQGRIRQQYFGRISDLIIGAKIMQLIGEAAPQMNDVSTPQEGCGEQGCAIPEVAS